jgi:hypothetical protein
MNLAETIYQKSLSLPPEQAQAVIDFIDSIKSHSSEIEQPVNTSTEPVSLLPFFEEAGLVGCLETDEQLSTTYKARLNFAHKHGAS